MKAAVICLMVILYAVATPADAGWTFIAENGSGDQFFIDLATFKKGARPRGWTLGNYAVRTEFGDLSHKRLLEADCSEGKIRTLAARFYTEPMGGGVPSTSNDLPSDWYYVTPGTITEEIARILCRGTR
jgi:hypothetical protein